MKDDNFYLCWSDLAWALRCRRSIIRFSVLIFAGIFFLFALLRTPRFVSEALFQVKGSRSINSGIVGGIIQLAAGNSSNQELELALTTLESRRVGEGVIRSAGLQIVPRSDGRSLRLLKNLKDNIFGEFAWWADRPSIATKARSHPWRFHNVHYQGIYPKAFTLSCGHDGTYVIQCREGKYEGELGELLCMGDLRFILEGDREALAGQSINFIAEPMFKAFNRYKRSLIAKMGKNKQAAISISYAHPSPNISVVVANALMHEYLRVTKLDAKRIVDDQMRFLARAQEDAWKDLSDQYRAHIDFAKESVEKGGYVRTKDALAIFTKNYGEISNKLGELEREFGMLEAADPILITTSHGPFQKQLADYNQRLRTLNTRKNSLELALQDSKALSKEMRHHLYAQEKEQQNRLDLISCLASAGDKKYIQSLIASCNLRRRIHEAKMASATSSSSEVQGMGLSAATANYEVSLQELRNLEKQGNALDQAIEQLENEAFDVGALIDTLGVGGDFQRKVQECHALSLALKDVGNYSAKELARKQEEFLVKNSALKEHLQGVRLVNASQRSDAKQSIQKAQASLLGLVFKEITLAEEEMRSTIERRRIDLESEIASHRASLAKIKQEMAAIPQALLREKKLDLQTRFQAEMMHAIVGLVESRQLSASLDIVEAKPLDEALFPIRPEAPNLVLWTIIGSIAGLLLGCLYTLTRAAFAGFPVSRDNLLVRNQFIVSAQDREKALFYSNQKVVYCTGLDIEEFLRLVRLAKEQGERVQIAARSCDYAEPDIILRRLHTREIQDNLSEEIDRLFVYIPQGPLDSQSLSMVGAVGDWIVGLRKEKVQELTPYFEISEKSRVAFLFSSSR